MCWGFKELNYGGLKNSCEFTTRLGKFTTNIVLPKKISFWKTVAGAVWIRLTQAVPLKNRVFWGYAGILAQYGIHSAILTVIEASVNVVSVNQMKHPIASVESVDPWPPL